MNEPIYNKLLGQFVRKHGHRPGKTPTAAEMATKLAIDKLASDAMALQTKRPSLSEYVLKKLFLSPRL